MFFYTFHVFFSVPVLIVDEFGHPFGLNENAIFIINLEKGGRVRVLRVRGNVPELVFSEYLFLICWITFWHPFNAFGFIVFGSTLDALDLFWCPFGSMLVHLALFLRFETDPASNDPPKQF